MLANDIVNFEQPGPILLREFNQKTQKLKVKEIPTPLLSPDLVSLIS